VVGLVGFGLALRRADIVALGAPFVLGPIVALLLTGRAQPRASLRVSAGDIREGEVLEAGISVDSASPLDLVTVSLATTGFVSPRGRREWVTVVDAAGHAEISVTLRAERWGRQSVGPLIVVARGPGAFTAPDAVVAPAIAVRVLPSRESFEARGAVPHALAYAGDHRSNRIGPGVEFASVRPFAPGDRLRNINWRATLRGSEIHVTSTSTERSAEIVVLVDSSHDAGPLGGSILDISVHAAGAIAEHYLARGDLVTMEEYGARHRRLPAGAGHRHADRAREWLMDVRPPFGERGSAFEPWLAGGTVSRSLVVVLTPLLDDYVAEQLASLRGRGSSVVAVDTLADGVRPEVHDDIERLARRVWMLEREMLIARLAELGVPTVRWAGAGSLDGVLAELVRMAGAPRVALR